MNFITILRLKPFQIKKKVLITMWTKTIEVEFCALKVNFANKTLTKECLLKLAQLSKYNWILWHPLLPVSQTIIVQLD